MSDRILYSDGSATGPYRLLQIGARSYQRRQFRAFGLIQALHHAPGPAPEPGGADPPGELGSACYPAISTP